MAEVFLPTSIDDEKKKPTQRNLTGSLSVSTPTGLGLPTGVKLFRKESLRPDTTNTVCAKEVLAECRQFEEIWTSHMETNRDRWIEEQEKGMFKQGSKDNCRPCRRLIFIFDFRGSYRSKTAIETRNFFKNSYIDLIELNKFYILSKNFLPLKRF